MQSGSKPKVVWRRTLAKKDVVEQFKKLFEPVIDFELLQHAKGYGGHVYLYTVYILYICGQSLLDENTGGELCALHELAFHRVELQWIQSDLRVTISCLVCINTGFGVWVTVIFKSHWVPLVGATLQMLWTLWWEDALVVAVARRWAPQTGCCTGCESVFKYIKGELLQNLGGF